MKLFPLFWPAKRFDCRALKRDDWPLNHLVGDTFGKLVFLPQLILFRKSFYELGIERWVHSADSSDTPGAVPKQMFYERWAVGK